MQALIDYGVSIIIALQGLGDWLIPIMEFFSRLGNEDFFFIVLPLAYWSVDSALGIRIGFILLASNYINFIGKIAFASPRPYWVSSHVRPLWPETSFGMPSGHAQIAMSVWGMFAAYRKQKWVTLICVILIFMIGFSRIVLGAHFPHDVLLGWLIGGMVLWAFIRYWDAAADWLATKSLRQQIAFAFGVSIVMILLGSMVISARSGFQIPEDWITNALRAGPTPAPVDPNGIYTSAGTFFGLAVGAAWIHSRGGFQADGPGWKRALRYLIGLIGILLFWMALGEIFPRGDGALVYSLRFLRYSLVGWWISGGAPFLFKHFNLTTS